MAPKARGREKPINIAVFQQDELDITDLSQEHPNDRQLGHSREGYGGRDRRDGFGGDSEGRMRGEEDDVANWRQGGPRKTQDNDFGGGRGGDFNRGDFGRGDNRGDFSRGDNRGDFSRGDNRGDFNRGDNRGDFGRGDFGRGDNRGGDFNSRPDSMGGRPGNPRRREDNYRSTTTTMGSSPAAGDDAEGVWRRPKPPQPTPSPVAPGPAADDQTSQTGASATAGVGKRKKFAFGSVLGASKPPASNEPDTSEADGNATTTQTQEPNKVTLDTPTTSAASIAVPRSGPAPAAQESGRFQTLNKDTAPVEAKKTAQESTTVPPAAKPSSRAAGLMADSSYSNAASKKDYKPAATSTAGSSGGRFGSVMSGGERASSAADNFPQVGVGMGSGSTRARDVSTAGMSGGSSTKASDGVILAPMTMGGGKPKIILHDLPKSGVSAASLNIVSASPGMASSGMPRRTMGEGRPVRQQRETEVSNSTEGNLNSAEDLHQQEKKKKKVNERKLALQAARRAAATTGPVRDPRERPLRGSPKEAELAALAFLELFERPSSVEVAEVTKTLESIEESTGLVSKALESSLLISCLFGALVKKVLSLLAELSDTQTDMTTAKLETVVDESLVNPTMALCETASLIVNSIYEKADIKENDDLTDVFEHLLIRELSRICSKCGAPRITPSITLTELMFIGMMKTCQFFTVQLFLDWQSDKLDETEGRFTSVAATGQIANFIKGSSNVTNTGSHEDATAGGGNQSDEEEEDRDYDDEDEDED